jgi:hypothetical protein
MSKEKRGEKKSDLEEHEIAGVFCSAVLLGDTSSDSTFLSKASPTRGGMPSEVCCGRKKVVKYLTVCLICQLPLLTLSNLFELSAVSQKLSNRMRREKEKMHVNVLCLVFI